MCLQRTVTVLMASPADEKIWIGCRDEEEPMRGIASIFVESRMRATQCISIARDAQEQSDVHAAQTRTGDATQCAAQYTCVSAA